MDELKIRTYKCLYNCIYNRPWINTLKNMFLFKRPVFFLIGAGVGAILYRWYLNHGLGWNWLAIDTATNIILVGALVCVTYQYVLEVRSQTRLANRQVNIMYKNARMTQLNEERGLLLGTLMKMEFFIRSHINFWELNYRYHFHQTTRGSDIQALDDFERSTVEKGHNLMNEIIRYKHLTLEKDFVKSIDEYIKAFEKYDKINWQYYSKEIDSKEQILFENVKKRDEEIAEELKSLDIGD